MTAQGLIDTTEMYLRTIFELEEEGVVPLRARIAERLAQSGPTVSQTVARMERDGLLHVAGDRQIALSDVGHALATRVMRKHRLAECLLVGVIKLPWEEVHIEACRWEHVISENVERRLVELLDWPVACPHGNIIPGLDELGVPPDARAVAANITIVNASSAGALEVMPAGVSTGTTTAQFRASRVIADNAVLGLTGTPLGSVSVQADMPAGSVDVILDVSGYFK